MQPQQIIIIPTPSAHVPMIDGEFDLFELNSDFEMHLREAEIATFYHDSLNQEE